MKVLKEYDVTFASLKLGDHQYDYEVKDALFEHFNFEDIADVDIKVDVLLHKRSSHLEFVMNHTGSIGVTCDLTGEAFRRNVEGELKLIVKFGEDYNFENEEIVIIPHGDYEFNIGQYIYEMIVLSIPAKNYHPGLEDGTLETDMVERLESYSSKGGEEENIEIDLRWSKLKDLLTDK